MSPASEQARGTVIVGGGISGLATAAALKRIAKVSNLHILESSPAESFHSDRAGAGAQLGPNGLRALRCIGGESLVQKVMEVGSKLEGNAILLPSPAPPMFLPDTAEVDTGLPQVFVRWGVLRSLLYGLLEEEEEKEEGVTISTGVGENVVGYHPLADGGVQLVVASEEGEASSSSLSSIPTHSVPLVIGADGVASTFRYLVRNGVETLPSNDNDNDNDDDAKRSDVKDGGRINIKAVIPRSMVEDESLLDLNIRPGYTYAHFASGGGVACFAGPAGDGWTYWAISIADESIDKGKKGEGEGNETEQEVLPFLSDLDVTTEKQTVKERLLSKLDSLQSPQCQFAIHLVQSTESSYIYCSRSEEATAIGPTLLSPDGNVVLVGDAAHAMSASYGQGPNFALEDAAMLAVLIRDSEDLTLALKAYSEKRVSRCLEMQKRSAERAAKAMKGEHTEDVSKWIFQWDVDA